MRVRGGSIFRLFSESLDPFFALFSKSLQWRLEIIASEKAAFAEDAVDHAGLEMDSRWSIRLEL